RRQQVVDDATLVLGRAGVAGRLVQHQQQALRRIQWLAVHAHVVVVQRIVLVQHLAVGVGDPALTEPPGHFLAAAIAQVGQVLDQLHRLAQRDTPFSASITLKPPPSASTRRWPNACSRVPSYGRWRLATSSRRPPGRSACAATSMKRWPSSGRSPRSWAWNGGLLTMKS